MFRHSLPSRSALAHTLAKQSCDPTPISQGSKGRSRRERRLEAPFDLALCKEGKSAVAHDALIGNASGTTHPSRKEQWIPGRRQTSKGKGSLVITSWPDSKALRAGADISHLQDSPLTAFKSSNWSVKPSEDVESRPFCQLSRRTPTIAGLASQVCGRRDEKGSEDSQLALDNTESARSGSDRTVPSLCSRENHHWLLQSGLVLPSHKCPVIRSCESSAF